MRDSETYEQSYAGNNSTVTAYQIQFRFIDSADLAVIVTDSDGAQTTLTPVTQYMVTRDATTELGSFVTTAAVPASSTVKIYRRNVLKQQLDYVNADAFPADSHEQGMDRLTEEVQSVRGEARHAFRVTAAHAEIDALRAIAHTVLGLDASGLPVLRTPEDLQSFIALPSPVINMPTKTWNNNAERAIAVPDFLGQVGVQRDTGALWVSTGMSAGNWTASVAGTVADLSITREKLSDGALTADVLGRAKMADLFVTLAKMNVDFITGMTEKANLESADMMPGWSATDNAFRKFAGSTIIPVGSVIQTVQATPYTANTNLTAIIPNDDTIPQITEGTQILTLTITPRFASSLIHLAFSGFACPSTQLTIAAALFRTPVTNALQATQIILAANFRGELSVSHMDAPATTGATTYTIRVGPGSSGTIRMNGNSAGRLFGGVASSTLVAQEIKV